MITWGYAGQLLTVGFGTWYVSDLFFGWLDERKERKADALRNLNAKVDRFTHKYGERSEDPDDQAYEA